jgi:hypothetical protein
MIRYIIKVLEDWTARWKKDPKRAERVERPRTDPGSRAVPENALPDKAVLKLHSGLRKAESFILVQARKGPIGLAKFLHIRKVSSVQTAQCRRRAGEETPQHMALFCIEEAGRREHLLTGGRLDY